MRRSGRFLLVWSLLHAALALGAGGGSRAAPPPPRVVSLTASDGTVLRATWFSAGRPGPAVLLFHQSNRDRRAWVPVGRALAAAGIHALTLDLRGFGESDGPRYATLRRQEIGRARAPWPEDIELAWRFLVSRPEVDGKRIGLGGAGVEGVGDAVETAQRHPGQVRSLLLISGETLLPGLRFLGQSPDLPVLCVVSDDDEYPPTVEAMELLAHPRQAARGLQLPERRPRAQGVRRRAPGSGDQRRDEPVGDRAGELRTALEEVGPVSTGCRDLADVEGLEP